MTEVMSDSDALSGLGEMNMEKKPESNQEVLGETASEEPALVQDPESQEEKLARELVESKDRLLRLAADFENFKKIAQREQQNGIKFANESLIVNLLPVIDNLEQAVIACKKSGDVNNNDVLIGVEMVLKQLVDVLGKFGIEVFSALGQPFDPARHEAMGEQEDGNAAVGSVLVEYQKGYLLHGRLLRPARVVIAKSPKVS
jgi:molecular chaperone GrpE